MKTLQLFETVQVRHGLMLVGQTMGGKTSVVNTLAKALEIQEQMMHGEEDGDNKLTVKVHTVNPKSVSIG